MTTSDSHSKQSLGFRPVFRNGPLGIFASVKLTIVLLTLCAATILLGAWCPQESAVGQEKVIEQFGEEMAVNLHNWGITDIFHTPFFLVLIALLSMNMVVGSLDKVFPKLRLLKLPLQFFGPDQIAKMPFNTTFTAGASPAETLEKLQIKLQQKGFKTVVHGNELAAESGKIGRYAPTTTHIGLLLLLLGVTITSWTGFSGFKPVRLGEDLSFQDSEHSKQWIGKLPTWKVHVDATRREDYESGDAKQWYSDLSVIDEKGKVLEKQQISVNTPLEYKGVDVYQSSWGLDQLVIAFNDNEKALDLRQMGKLYAAFLPLDGETVLIMSLRNQTAPLRLFAKRPDWEAPKLITEIQQGKSVKLGSVEIKYVRPVPVTGLQYKSDPGLPITYIAFGFIMLGVMLAAIPFRHVWVSVSKDGAESGSKVSIGGRSKKAKVGFERMITKIIESMQAELPPPVVATAVDPETEVQGTEAEPPKNLDLFQAGPSTSIKE
ncbi:MAG: cytochrome c biogenesis protein ResB [Candidatus Obscuribacterales bacterium]